MPDLPSSGSTVKVACWVGLVSILVKHFGLKKKWFKQKIKTTYFLVPSSPGALPSVATNGRPRVSICSTLRWSRCWRVAWWGWYKHVLSTPLLTFTKFTQTLSILLLLWFIVNFHYHPLVQFPLSSYISKPSFSFCEILLMASHIYLHCICIMLF